MEDVTPLDLAALELLAANRNAAAQETTDRARAIHEKSLEADEKLTLISQVGAEAIRLYEIFELREAYFMGAKQSPTLLDSFRAGGILDSEGIKFRLAHERRARRYAKHIVEARDGELTIEQAYRMAHSEIVRTDQENRQNKTAQRFGFGNMKTKISTSYEYFSPPLLVTEAEKVEGVPVSQQWRVKANQPNTYNGFNKVLTTLHEFKYDDRKSTRVHNMVIIQESGLEVVTERTRDGEKVLEENELFFPLGLLISAQEAVVASVPNKISKKW